MEVAPSEVAGVSGHLYDIVDVLRLCGIDVPQDTDAVTVDDEQAPTWIKFHYHRGPLRGVQRRTLDSDQQDRVAKAVQAQRAGWRLAGSKRP